jgi:alpha-L-fucosidase 2
VVNPDLLKACRRAIELRMNERVKQDGGEMAFGIVQLGQAAVSMGEGETVYTMLRWLANRYYYSNLVSSHNPGPSIFNVDISGGLPDLVIRMLVQSKPGRIDLLPALPAALSSGSISGVLAHGQVLVKSLEWQPAGLVAVLHSPKGQTVQVSARGTTRAVRLASGKDTRLEFELENRR